MTMANYNLYVHRADGAVESATSEQILTAARQVLAHRVRRGASLNSPRSVYEYLAVKLGALDYEVFGLILVDQRHKVIECVELFRGTLSGANVYPREIVKLVLEKEAAGVVLFHNHPSSVNEYSHADELITKRLVSCLELIDAKVIDHLIVGAGDVLSFAESGLL
jgi:DNA repair protein RadC